MSVPEAYPSRPCCEPKDLDKLNGGYRLRYAACAGRHASARERGFLMEEVRAYEKPATSSAIRHRA